MPNQIDMLHGPLTGKLLKFALPFAACGILQQLFNSVDVAVVGRFASSEALAAVGANTFLINLMINLFIGISIGANAVIANRIGQRDDEGIAHAVSTTMLLSLISGFLLLVVGLIISRPVLTLMETPPNVIDDAVLYLRIYFLGAPFFLVYNFGASVLRSKGDTRRPLFILLVAGLINTILNLFFVIVCHMSVAGVAIATAISNIYCAAVVVNILRHEEGPLQLQIRQLKLYKRECRNILQIGIPAGLQGMVFSFSNVFVQWAINGYGSAAIAGSSVAQTFESYCYFLIASFGGAATTFIGQCYGAGDTHRCRRIYWQCMVLAFTFCLAANWLFYWQWQPLLGLFSEDQAVIHFAYLRMGCVLIFQSIASSYEISASAMRGFGKSTLPAILTIFGTCVLRLVWIFAVCPFLPGYDMLLYVYPISWVLTGILVCTAYAITSRKAWRLIEKE
ncbi:MAG: MATE family efflux transporter [Prevotella sp.]|jgi:putative MATE family efflux protein